MFRCTSRRSWCWHSAQALWALERWRRPGASNWPNFETSKLRHQYRFTVHVHLDHQIIRSSVHAVNHGATDTGAQVQAKVSNSTLRNHSAPEILQSLASWVWQDFSDPYRSSIWHPHSFERELGSCKWPRVDTVTEFSRRKGNRILETRVCCTDRENSKGLLKNSLNHRSVASTLFVMLPSSCGFPSVPSFLKCKTQSETNTLGSIICCSTTAITVLSSQLLCVLLSALTKQSTSFSQPLATWDKILRPKIDRQEAFWPEKFETG